MFKSTIPDVDYDSYVPPLGKPPRFSVPLLFHKRDLKVVFDSSLAEIQETLTERVGFMLDTLSAVPNFDKGFLSQKAGASRVTKNMSSLTD